MKKSLVIILSAFLAVGIASCGVTSSTDETTTTTTTTTVIQTNETKETEKQTTTTREETTSTKQTTAAPAVEESYEHNSNYDVIEKATFKDSIGITHVIHKVKAKKDATISATLMAYDANNNVIGKSEDRIVLTNGQNNFFEYIFEPDISNAKITAQMEADNDSFMDGPRNAVQMVTSNKTGDDLFITFKQVTDELGSTAKFKILYYKGGKIIDAEKNGYFVVYAKNMKGKGSTDVAKVWVYDIAYDKFEVYFEP
ncbi:MAG: hypothetical protein J5956_11845 [Ruminococcus sp.]|nr:hypothetical protein [Ruminococcus sp.]